MATSEDAVFTAAVSRDEVRKSLNRMEYHLGRGPKGALGVTREVGFLDAMSRQSTRLAGSGLTGKTGLGTRAKAAMEAAAGGNTAQAGRLKSSLLASYSEDTMNGAREWTYAGDKAWIWTANASACAACLDNHGQGFAGAFVPMHPSCLCFPQDPEQAGANGVQTLSDDQIVQTLLTSNNAAFREAGRLVQSGRMTVGDAATLARRRSPAGRRAWQKAMDAQAQRSLGQAAASPAPEGAVATVATEVPTITEITAAAVEPVAAAPIDWVASMKATNTRFKFKAARHEQTIRQAQRILNRAVDDVAFKAKLDEAVRGLTEFVTKSDTNRGKVDWAGVFKHRKRVGRGAFDADITTFRSIEIQMRTTNQAEMAAYNARVKVYNDAHRLLSDEALTLRRTQGSGFTAEKENLLRRQKELNKTRPSPSKDGIYVDRTAQDVADILLHEVTHAVDELADHALSAKALKDGIRDEFRALYNAGDPAFKYGAEVSLGAKNGHETFAEVVRMYFNGTGVMTPQGVTPQNALAWRAQHKVLAEWVEVNVLG